jgi:hypothetical protein
MRSPILPDPSQKASIGAIRKGLKPGTTLRAVPRNRSGRITQVFADFVDIVCGAFRVMAIRAPSKRGRIYANGNTRHKNAAVKLQNHL